MWYTKEEAFVRASICKYIVMGTVVEAHGWQHIDTSQIAKFMGPTWGPPGAGRTQEGPMLAPWILLSCIWYLE